MRAFGKLCLLATLSCAVAFMQTTNVVEFGEMVHCLTDQSHINSFLDYEGYGCWCGLGGAGTPLDETDRCCKIHDECYDIASGDCPFDEYVYVVLYIFSTANCREPSASVTCVASMQTSNVVQFGDMIHCLTDQSIVSTVMNYGGYGCWCGLGGAGTPLDETDTCCMIHDKCYDTASELCPFHDYVYIVMYISSTHDCRGPNAAVTCFKPDEYKGFFTQWKKCRAAICECDRAAAECFAASSFDESLKDWPKDTC